MSHLDIIRKHVFANCKIRFFSKKKLTAKNVSGDKAELSSPYYLRLMLNYNNRYTRLFTVFCEETGAQRKIVLIRH